MGVSLDREVTAAARYRPLGALRFALSALVVLQHFQYLLPVPQRAVFSHAGLGAVAVAVFFVVSGFVVTEANLVFYRGRPGAFLANRAFRVAPPYFAALAVSVAVHEALWSQGRLVLWDYPVTGSPLAPAPLATGVLGLLPAFNARLLLGHDFEFIPFVWTLRVEIAFYLAAASVLAIAAMWRPAIPAAIAAVLAASAVFLLRMRPGLLSDAPMFLLGVCACAGFRFGRATGMAFAVAAFALSAAGFLSWQQRGAPVLAIQTPLLLALLAATLVLAQARCPRWWLRADRALGALSYPLYLNHYAVGIYVWNVFSARGLGIYGAACGGAVALSWAMAVGVERPVRGIRNRIRKAVLV